MARLNRRQHNRRSAGAWAVIIGGGGEGSSYTPVAVIDFANAVYTANGSPVALSALVGNAEEYTFSDTHIVPGTGFRPADQSGMVGFALTGAAGSAMISGGTFVVTCLLDSPVAYDLHSPDFDYYVTGDFGSAYVQDDVTEATLELGGPYTGLHRFAVTMIEGKAAVSRNGAATVTSDAFSVYGATPPSELAMKVNSDGNTGIVRIDVYAPVPDADLPGLSAL